MKKLGLILTGIIALMLYTSCETEEMKQLEIPCDCYYADKGRRLSTFITRFDRGDRQYYKLDLITPFNDTVVINLNSVNQDWIKSLVGENVSEAFPALSHPDCKNKDYYFNWMGRPY